MRDSWHKPSKAMGLLVLVIAAALVAVVVSAVRTPGSGQHHTSDSLSSARPRVSPVSPVSPARPCTGTALTPASNVQAAINGAPPGTTFCFGRGVYRVSSLIPKSGDVLDGGDRAAILDGGNSAAFAIYGDSTCPARRMSRSGDLSSGTSIHRCSVDQSRTITARAGLSRTTTSPRTRRPEWRPVTTSGCSVT